MKPDLHRIVKLAQSGLVPNPNPEGHKEMVTPEYAQQWEAEHGKSNILKTKSLDPSSLEPHHKEFYDKIKNNKPYQLDPMIDLVKKELPLAKEKLNKSEKRVNDLRSKPAYKDSPTLENAEREYNSNKRFFDDHSKRLEILNHVRESNFGEKAEKLPFEKSRVDRNRLLDDVAEERGYHPGNR